MSHSTHTHIQSTLHSYGIQSTDLFSALLQDQPQSTSTSTSTSPSPPIPTARHHKPPRYVNSSQLINSLISQDVDPSPTYIQLAKDILFPLGDHAIVEIFGEASTGKTNICLSLIHSVLASDNAIYTKTSGPTGATMKTKDHGIHQKRQHPSVMVLSKTPAIYTTALGRSVSTNDGINPLTDVGIYQATSCSHLLSILQQLDIAGNTAATDITGSIHHDNTPFMTTSTSRPLPPITPSTPHKPSTSPRPPTSSSPPPPSPSPSSSSSVTSPLVKGETIPCLSCFNLDNSRCRACQYLHPSPLSHDQITLHPPTLVVIDPITFFIPDYNLDFRFNQSSSSNPPPKHPNNGDHGHGAASQKTQPGQFNDTSPQSYHVGGFGPGLYHKLTNLMKKIHTEQGTTFVLVNEVSDVFNSLSYTPSNLPQGKRPFRSTVSNQDEDNGMVVDHQFLHHLQESISPQSHLSPAPNSQSYSSSIYAYPHHIYSCNRLIKPRLGLPWAFCPHIRIALTRTRRNELFLNDHMRYIQQCGISSHYIDNIIEQICSGNITWHDDTQKHLLGAMYAAIHHCVKKITHAKEIEYFMPIHTLLNEVKVSLCTNGIGEGVIASWPLNNIDEINDELRQLFISSLSEEFHSSLEVFLPSYAHRDSTGNPLLDEHHTNAFKSLSSLRIAHFLQSPSSPAYSRCFVVLNNKAYFVGIPMMLRMD